MKSYKDLLEEAYENAKKDREILTKTLTGVDDAETVALLVEGLTKCNAQIVELVKTEAKTKQQQEDDISGKELEQIMNAIESKKKEETVV